MTTIEIEQKLSAAFHGGEVLRRELRLSPEEAEYVRAHCAAVVRPLGPSRDKAWYEISFRGAEN